MRKEYKTICDVCKRCYNLCKDNGLTEKARNDILKCPKGWFYSPNGSINIRGMNIIHICGECIDKFLYI